MSTHINTHSLYPFFQRHIKNLSLLLIEVISDCIVKKPICRETHVEVKQRFIRAVLHHIQEYGSLDSATTRKCCLPDITGLVDIG